MKSELRTNLRQYLTEKLIPKKKRNVFYGLDFQKSQVEKAYNLMF